MTELTIGVLALQGCVQPHRLHVESLGMRFKEVRREVDLNSVHGLIIPGGESTTMLKLIHTFSLSEGLRASANRIPVWGVCAGAILMARQVYSPKQESFGFLNIEVERNSYGRQLESFEAEVEGYPVAFIRAPKILSVGREVEVYARKEATPIWVQSGIHMATTFHPELNRDAPSPMHRRFAESVGRLI